MTINIKEISNFINVEFGFRLQIVRHGNGEFPTVMESALEGGNPLRTLFKEIKAVVSIFESFAEVKYEYTHPNGSTNGYILGYVEIDDKGEFIYKHN